MTATSNGHRAARVAPGATVAPFELPTRAVDLAHAATLAEWATQPARIMDVTKTVNTAVNRLADFVVEAVAVGDGELGREVDDLAAQIGDLSRRLERAELETQLSGASINRSHNVSAPGRQKSRLQGRKRSRSRRTLEGSPICLDHAGKAQTQSAAYRA